MTQRPVRRRPPPADNGEGERSSLPSADGPMASPVGALPQAGANPCSVQARAEAMWRSDSASRELGMRLEHVAPGQARLSLPVTAAMANGIGICHGGFIFSLADSAMAFAANQCAGADVAQHAAITFLRPGRIGETLVAEAMERARAGRSGLYDVRVSTSDGALVAEFRGHTRTLRTEK